MTIKDYDEMKKSKFFPKEGAAKIAGELMVKMAWKARNAATSSAMELDRPRGGEEGFADSIEEELAYCAQTMVNIKQGQVSGGFSSPDMEVLADLLDVITHNLMAIRLEVAFCQVDPERKMDELFVKEVRDYLVKNIDVVASHHLEIARRLSGKKEQ